MRVGKTQLVSSDRSNITGAIYVKMNRSVLEEKTSFMMLGMFFSSNWDWDTCIVSLAKLPPRKLKHGLFYEVSFF